MFIINKDTNRIEKVEEVILSKIGLKEREHLQEWIANKPESLGEDLLVIQKEFDGFGETRERLDLLALDKQGNLVVIENKLDDSGRDVTWQVLKYASYCSSLSRTQIIKIYQDFLSKSGSETAEEKLCEFYDVSEIEEISLNNGITQRIIMVSGSFRKEVTSTVLWLMNYNLRIQCFKITPYKMGDQLLVNFEQIIPMKDAEEYSISMAEKTQEDISSQAELKTRHLIRREFWTKLLKAANDKSKLFQNISPSIYNWIGAGSGVRGFGYNYVISKKYARCEMYIDRGERDENKKMFDYFLTKKEEIENEFGGSLEWERLDDKRASRIKYENSDFNVFEKEQWDDIVDFLSDGMVRMEQAFQKLINRIQKNIIKH